MIIGFILVELEGNRLQIWSSCSRRNRALIMGPWRLVHTSSCLNEKRAMKCYHNEPMENVQEIALFETFWKYAAYDYCRTVYGKSVICMRNAYAHPQLLAQHVHLNDFEPASMTADSVHIFNHHSTISSAWHSHWRSDQRKRKLHCPQSSGRSAVGQPAKTSAHLSFPFFKCKIQCGELQIHSNIDIWYLSEYVYKIL